MIPRTRLASLCLLAAIALPVGAQPSAAPELADAAASAGASKPCLAATRKVDREQKALTAANETIAKDKKGRETCTSKNMCARYDSAIADFEKRKARHETRLARFKDDAEKACKAP